VSNKQLVTNLLDRLPDDVSLRDIAKEIEFISGVREGLDQLDRGDGVPLEDVEKMIASWTKE
jgi:predicted transcriptional regulator